MKTAAQWAKECIRQFGYGVKHDFARQVQIEALRWAADQLVTDGNPESARAKIMQQVALIDNP